MPPNPETPQPRAAAARRVAIPNRSGTGRGNPPPASASIAKYSPRYARLALLALLVLPRVASAWGTTMDPVFVFYPRDFCSGERLAVEVWNRDAQRWMKHPRHPVIPVDSCQLEDAGVLLNEIRWRCLDAAGTDLDAAWKVGVRVFEPDVMQRCDVVRTGGGFGETEIRVSTPKPGETISDPNGNVNIEGSVWIGGLAGAKYDVVIAIDTSSPEARADGGAPRAESSSSQTPPQLSTVDPLGAQVRAARAFVDSIADRLGEVRVGIVSFPGPDWRAAQASDPTLRAAAEGDPEARLARREIALTDNAAAIHRTLSRMLSRDREGPMSFEDGLALALDELFRPPDWPGAARPGARRIVMISADGSGEFPFGLGAQADRDFRERNVERARHASHRGVVLHLFALGGIAEQPPPFIDQMLASSASSFTRVKPLELENFFADRVSMPFLEDISIRHATSGETIDTLEYTPDGRFAASARLEPGKNLLLVRARTSDGDERESQLVVDFDASAYRNRLLDQEAARMRRMRSKHLSLEIVD